MMDDGLDDLGKRILSMGEDGAMVMRYACGDIQFRTYVMKCDIRGMDYNMRILSSVLGFWKKYLEILSGRPHTLVDDDAIESLRRRCRELSLEMENLHRKEIDNL